MKRSLVLLLAFLGPGWKVEPYDRLFHLRGMEAEWVDRLDTERFSRGLDRSRVGDLAVVCGLFVERAGISCDGGKWVGAWGG